VAITFEGKDYTRPCWNPGIVVYGGNFNPHVSDLYVSDLSYGDFTAVLSTVDFLFTLLLGVGLLFLVLFQA